MFLGLLCVGGVGVEVAGLDGGCETGLYASCDRRGASGVHGNLVFELSRVCILFLDDPPMPGSGEVMGVLRKL